MGMLAVKVSEVSAHSLPAFNEGRYWVLVPSPGQKAISQSPLALALILMVYSTPFTNGVFRS